MSVVTSIIIIFPYSESELERIEEINNFCFKGNKYTFQWIEGDKVGRLCYSGNKKFNSVVLLASYNSFPTEEFIMYLSREVKWEDPEFVPVLVNSESTNDRSFKMYKAAGTILIADSEKW